MRARVLALVVALVVLLGGGATIGAVVVSDHAARTAAAQARAAVIATRTAAEVRRQRGAAAGIQDPVTSQAPPPGASTSKAIPTRIVIPAIHVDATLEHLHRDAKGVLQPPSRWPDAGWYADGVVPGHIGPAVIAGHLDTTLREAVFAFLQRLRPGNRIMVHMSDGSTVTFAVDHSRVVKKALFPTDAVYGSTPDPQLRLITCNEPFDEVHGVYADNLVVYATEVH